MAFSTRLSTYGSETYIPKAPSAIDSRIMATIRGTKSLEAWNMYTAQTVVARSVEVRKIQRHSRCTFLQQVVMVGKGGKRMLAKAIPKDMMNYALQSTYCSGCGLCTGVG